MGEQLICKMNPTSELVKKQLSQLRDQWQTLKQTAANQTRALGGAKILQEFNKKVDKLEAWMKEKVKKTFFSFSVVMLSVRSPFNCRRRSIFCPFCAKWANLNFEDCIFK